MIGLFTMVAMSPLGGYIGKLFHEKQTIKMKLVGCFFFPTNTIINGVPL